MVDPDVLRALPLHASSLFHLQQNIILIIVVLNVDLDAILVVGPWKHQFSR